MTNEVANKKGEVKEKTFPYLEKLNKINNKLNKNTTKSLALNKKLINLNIGSNHHCHEKNNYFFNGCLVLVPNVGSRFRHTVYLSF